MSMSLVAVHLGDRHGEGWLRQGQRRPLAARNQRRSGCREPPPPPPSLLQQVPCFTPLFSLLCVVEGRAEERKREDDENGNVV